MNALRNAPFLCAALLSLLTTTGCWGRKQKPALSLILVCDVSASIDEAARASCLNTVGSVLPILRRGDSLVVIPVMGDAEAEISGQILRFNIPSQRELYDEDLRRMQTRAEQEIGNLIKTASANPGQHTDLLGTMRAAAQELSGLSPERKRVLVLLTDGIQDDAQFNFNTAPELASKNGGTKLATSLAQENPAFLKDVTIYFGRLKSRDLARLPRSRREALNTFWMKYFEAAGAHPQSVVDGPGLMPRFLESMREPRPSGNSGMVAAQQGAATFHERTP